MLITSCSRILSRGIVPICRLSKMPSSDMAKFREVFKKAEKIVVLTGAGVSAESGVPTFRGSGGLWRTYKSQDLATPDAFYRDPSLVWEFYHYRREVMCTKKPNAAHVAIAESQALIRGKGREMTVVTQNIDELHHAAGTQDVIELHGSLFRTLCIKCGDTRANRDSPICEALRGKGAPDRDTKASNIPEEQLPHCQKCKGLLRPSVVWFGEMLDDDILLKAHKAIGECDLCLVVGTSSVVYPAAMFAPQVAARGVAVAEFNMEVTPTTQQFGFHFQGPCGELLPIALSPY
uniref:NAD-dependent protein deacylase n=1 Tax=Hirondellea gigas TaxID=1518452 RepID=A0A2P2HXU2_9CRUS